MQDLIKQIEKNIQENNLIGAKEKLIVGVSGGPDSMMLLHALNILKDKLDFTFVVAHINHNIRSEAIKDQELVRKYCENFGIEFNLLNADVLTKANMLKISTEECGRNIRYEFFNKLLKEKNAQKIVVAHNLGDNAETMLLNLVRGSGLNGICNMKWKNGNIIRPMLNIDKSEILEYLDENKIEYAIDKTNFTNDYTRNFIRNEIVPNFKKINPNFLNTMFRTGNILSSDEALLFKLTKREATNIILKEQSTLDLITIDVKSFWKLEPELKPRVIMYILGTLLGNIQGIERIHIEDIVLLLDKCITGKKYIIGNKFYIEILKNKKAKCVKTTTIIEKK